VCVNRRACLAHGGAPHTLQKHTECMVKNLVYAWSSFAKWASAEVPALPIHLPQTATPCKEVTKCMNEQWEVCCKLNSCSSEGMVCVTRRRPADMCIRQYSDQRLVNHQCRAYAVVANGTIKAGGTMTDTSTLSRLQSSTQSQLYMSTARVWIRWRMFNCGVCPAHILALPSPSGPSLSQVLRGANQYELNQATTAEYRFNQLSLAV
jgi:hypothetical protein